MAVSSHTLAPEVAPFAEERARLDRISRTYDSSRGLNRELIKWGAAHIVVHGRGARALEFGCANGVMTEELASCFPQLDVVEGADAYARLARAIVGRRGTVHHCLFEEFEPRRAYDVIVMAWVLEHVADPNALLTRARPWLAEEGTVHIIVPNAESLHRRVGLQMGLLDRLDALNESDVAVGHRRVYTWDTLARDITSAGLRIAHMEGILIKPLPSLLMERWSAQRRAAFFQLAPLLPRLCSEIYAVCTHPDHVSPTHPPHGVR
jgi:hypothetical protein